MISCKKITPPLRKTLLLLAFFLLILVLFTVPTFALTETLDRGLNLFASGLLKASDFVVSGGQIIFLQVIYNTILEFGKFWSDSGGGAVFLKEVWRSVRDIVNLLIVVLFVVITMLTVFGEFSFRRTTLVGLILAALLVNFSAFFVLFVIDISNILFVMFFNLLNISEIGTLSPFHAIASNSVLIDNAGWNFLFSIIAFIVSFFIFAGILYLCIILIERFIIALFLVVSSPLLVIGFFLNAFGSNNPLAAPFIRVYTIGRERLLYIFSSPIIIMFGYAVLYSLFLTVIGRAVENISGGDVAVRASEAIGPDFFQIILASIIFIYGIFQVGKLAQNANITGAGGFTLFGKNFKPGAFFKQRASNIAHPGRAARGIVRNTLGRIPGVKGVLGSVGLGAPRTRFYEPGQRFGSAVRAAANFTKDAESGRYWENKATTFNEFRAKHKTFSNVGDGIYQWNERKQERYHQLNDRIASFMSNDERKKSAAEGREDGWLKSQMRQMDSFLNEGRGDNSGNTTDAGGGGGAPTGGGEGGDSNGGGGGNNTPDSGGGENTPANGAPTSGSRNAGAGRRDEVGGSSRNNTSRNTLNRGGRRGTQTAGAPASSGRNAGVGGRDEVGGGFGSNFSRGGQNTARNPSGRGSATRADLGGDNQTGGSPTSGSRNAGVGRRDEVGRGSSGRNTQRNAANNTRRQNTTGSSTATPGSPGQERNNRPVGRPTSGGENTNIGRRNQSANTPTGNTGETTTNEHTILGVGGNASWDDVKKAYRRLAQQHHPDQGGSHEKMAEINVAYKALKKRYNQK